MKHKHYDKIVAKAENMDLVVLIKSKVTNRWEVLDSSCIPSFYEESEYFLCLPQHKEVCLHWLNGGEVQDFFEGEWVYCASLAHATEAGGDNTLEFSEHHMFMNEEFQFRIAPKKEQRWILECNGTLLTTRIFTNKDAAKLWIDEFDRADEGVSVVEIEIEVTG